MSTGICRLCGSHSDLKQSHIFPKFIFNWMKNTGGKYFRGAEAPQARKQDGFKEYMLCGVCEQRFSTRENYFKENIFDPYLQTTPSPISYNNHAFYFLISIFWRILANAIDSGEIKDHPHFDTLQDAELDWRNFLLDLNPSPKYNEVHMFLTDLLTNDVLPVKNLNLYYTRAVDGTVISGNKQCAVYAKFSRFMCFAYITPIDHKLWINTKINDCGGTLVVPQEILDGHIGEFLLDRANEASVVLDSPLTEKQLQYYSGMIAADPSKFMNSDLGKVIIADRTSKIDPHVLEGKDSINTKDPLS
jgi:hypothetical protein